MVVKTDLLVIGGGPSGLVSALRASEMGLDVVLAEKNDIGGVCLNKGCIPSKALANTADLVYYPNNSEEMGVEGDVKIDYKKTVEWSDGNIDKIVSNSKKHLKKSGVDVRMDKASFISSNEAKVGKEKVKFDNAIIATGSVPTEIPNLPFDNESVISSDQFFKMDSLPEEFIIIGAGYIGMELGTISHKLGSEVTILEAEKQILPQFSRRVITPISRKAKKIGLNIKLNQMVQDLEKKDDKVVLKTEDDEFAADKCLISVGRNPSTDGLGLSNTDVELDENGFVKTDESFETDDSGIYAVGDVSGGKMLAHEGYNEASIAVDTILGKSKEKSLIPAVVFTDPQLSQVGELNGYNVGRASFRAVGAAYTKNKVMGTVRIAVDNNGVVKGGQIVGPEASEIIHEVAVAVENKLPAEDIVGTVHAHPTVSEGIVLAVEDALDLPSSSI